MPHFFNVALLAHADQFGLQRTVFGGQIGADRGGVTHRAAFPFFEAGITDVQFGRNLGTPLVLKQAEELADAWMMGA